MLFSHRLQNWKHTDNSKYTGDYYLCSKINQWVYLCVDNKGRLFETIDEPKAEIIDLTSYTAIIANVANNTLEITKHE